MPVYNNLNFREDKGDDGFVVMKPIKRNSNSKVSKSDKPLPIAKRKKVKINNHTLDKAVGNDGFIVMTPTPVPTPTTKETKSSNVKNRLMKIMQCDGQGNSNDNSISNTSPIITDRELQIILDVERNEMETRNIMNNENVDEDVNSLTEIELRLLNPNLHELAIHFKKYYDKIISHFNSPQDERKSLVLTFNHYMRRYSSTDSPNADLIDWFYNILEINSGYLTCNMDFLELGYFKEVFKTFSNPNYLKTARYNRLYGNEPYKIHKNFEQHLFNELQNRSNFQNSYFDMMYFSGKDYPGFMRLPISVKRNMTIDDVKPLTQEVIDEKIDETQSFLSLIYIFREAVKKFRLKFNITIPVDHLENKLDCDNDDDDDLDLPDEVIKLFLADEEISEEVKTILREELAKKKPVKE